jgi:hypothetical protein
MIYIKSIVAGLVAVFSVAVLLVIYVWVSLGAIQLDPISLIRPGPVLIILLIILAVFVAGFLWEFRRASR